MDDVFVQLKKEDCRLKEKLHILQRYESVLPLYILTTLVDLLLT